MRWFLLWTVLVVAALALWAVLGRRLWQQVKALSRETKLATERFEAVTVALGRLHGAAPVSVAREPSHRDPGTTASGTAASRPEWDVRRRGRRVRAR